MDPGERNRLHATLVLYQYWSAALLACNKEQSTMSTDTGDDSGATDREATEPPIGVVGNTGRDGTGIGAQETNNTTTMTTTTTTMTMTTHYNNRSTNPTTQQQIHNNMKQQQQPTQQ